mgnify:CR=1 FL=1
MDFEFVHRLDKAKNQWNISIQGEIDIYNSSLLKDKLYELLEQEKRIYTLIAKALNISTARVWAPWYLSLKKLNNLKEISICLT